MSGIAFVIMTMKAVTLVFGTILTWLSVRAYRRTGAPSLRALASGIGLVTLGAVLGGLVHQLLGLGMLVAVAIQSVFTAAGFAVLTYSLYADGASMRSAPPSGTATRR